MEKDFILVIEDNESILFNLKLLLELNGFKIQTAINGREALEVLQNSPIHPDLILSDIVMPEMDGYELLKNVSNNSNWNMIPFIFLTAKASSEEVRLGKILGADDYLVKPIDEELLLGLIRNKIQKVRNLELELKNAINSKILLLFKDLEGTNENFETNNSLCLFITEYNSNHEVNIMKKVTDKRLQDIDLDTFIENLFQQSLSIFDKEGNISLNSILVSLNDLELQMLLHFGNQSNQPDQNKGKTIMIGIITPKISYYDKLRLENTIQSLFSEITQDRIIDLDYYYDEILSIKCTEN